MLCVNAKEEELAPLIYTNWPNAIPMEEGSKSVNWWPILGFPEGTNTNNKTALDDVFGWKDETEDHSRARPSKSILSMKLHILMLHSLSQIPQSRKHGKWTRRHVKIVD